MEEELGERVALLRLVRERKARKQRERLWPQFERAKAFRFCAGRWAEPTQHLPIIGRSCARACAGVGGPSFKGPVHG